MEPCSCVAPSWHLHRINTSWKLPGRSFKHVEDRGQNLFPEAPRLAFDVSFHSHIGREGVREGGREAENIYVKEQVEEEYEKEEEEEDRKLEQEEGRSWGGK
ncbi:hypothetical protein O3P69_016947 [Scylla paramamosain]|uniref:Uncharacterized protein n=1 Tax=Scylla paramamosain TaxID=85552 RepID=A0AAW0TUD7_SCYPA